MRYARAVLVAVLSPLLEKNPAKTFAVESPVVLSMSRCIVAVFAIAFVHQIWRDGVTSWPEAVFGVALVIAIPLLAALDRVKPEVVLDFGKHLVSRFGIGGSRTIGSLGGGGNARTDDERGGHREREDVAP